MYLIYSKPSCTYCDQAKALLNSKGLQYLELILDLGQPKEYGKQYVTLSHLKALIPSVKTVPQIFLDDKLIGGFVELKESLK